MAQTTSLVFNGGVIPSPSPAPAGSGKAKLLKIGEITVTEQEVQVTKKVICDPDSITTVAPFMEVLTSARLAELISANSILVLDDGTVQYLMADATVVVEDGTSVCTSVSFLGLSLEDRAKVLYPCTRITDELTLQQVLEVGEPVETGFDLVKAYPEDTEAGTLIDKLTVEDTVQGPDDQTLLEVVQGDQKVAINEDNLRNNIDNIYNSIDGIIETIDEMDFDSVPRAYLASTLNQSHGDSVTTRTTIDVFSVTAIEGECFEFEQTTVIDDIPFGYVWVEQGTYLINAAVTLQWVGNPRGTFIAKVGKVMGENFDFSQEQEISRQSTKVVTIPNRMKLAVNVTYDVGTPVMGFWIQSMQVVKLAGGMSQTNIVHDVTLVGQGSVADPLGVDEEKVAQSTLAKITMPANLQSSVLHVDEVQGYYDSQGNLQASDNPRFLSRKYIVGGDLGFTVRANMYGAMAVCEFDENDNFIRSHKLSGNPYDRIEFITHVNCSYLWVPTDTSVNSYTGVFPNTEQQLNKDLEVLNYAFVADNILGSENGYYGTDGTFTPSTSLLTLEYSVEPSTQYVWVGDIFGGMSAIELTSTGKVIAIHKNPNRPNEAKEVRITTSETASSLKVTSRTSVDFTKPWLLKIAKNETSENVTRPDLVAEGIGYYTEGGVLTVNDNFMFKRYSVNGSRYLRAAGYFFGTMRVCEFDKNGVFICSHYKRGDYTSIEFVTRHDCSYVGIATKLSIGIAADLLELGDNKVPFPRVLYGVEGVQKNIYNDRFGIQPYGNVYIVPNPSEDNSNYTRLHNRLEFNVASPGNFSINVWASVNGKSVFGDDITPSSSATVKFKAKSNPATAKNILWVGDSISDYQNTAKYARQIFDGITSGVAPTFVGTRHTTGTPDESYVGRTTYWLLRENGSPFRYNGAVDFVHYNSVVGVSKIDVCVMAMGFNDASSITLSHSSTLAECKTLYKEFIEKITAANPGIKIVWVLCPFGAKLEKVRNMAAHIEGAVMLRNLVLELSYEYTNIIVSDAFYCIDSVNGYPLTEVPIASVYSSLGRTQEFCSDSTHPTALGCKEWGQNVVGAIIEAFGL